MLRMPYPSRTNFAVVMAVIESVAETSLSQFNLIIHELIAITFASRAVINTNIVDTNS